MIKHKSNKKLIQIKERVCKKVKTMKILWKRNRLSKKIAKRELENARNYPVSDRHHQHDESEENLSFLTDDILNKFRNRKSMNCLNYKKSLKSVIEEAKRELDNNYFNTDICVPSSEEYVDYENIVFSSNCSNDNCESDYIEMK